MNFKCVRRSTLVAFLSSAVLFSTASSLAAAPASAKAFGLGKPSSSDELPPGRLRSKIETLPAPAQARALDWLQRFEFTEQDLQNLNADEEGGVFYADTNTAEAPGPEQASTVSGAGTAMVSTPEEAFTLHSRPGAFNKVFLDFDGHVIDGTAWNGTTGTLVAKAYDLDGDPTSWSADELNAIAEIWHRVAEDLAPFDVDVTTEDPGVFDSYTGHLLITEDTDVTGKDMPARGAGGVAYVNVFGSNSYGYYSPAFVYFDNLGAGWPPYVAEAAAHEMGHNFGLSHDGKTDGTAYYTGHGSGYTSWAPIMGVGYYQQVTQWSKGEYAGANNLQDDIAILDAKLRYRADDHGDDMASASELWIDGVGNVIATNPQDDPANTYPENKGVVEQRSDNDWFGFNTGGGNVSLSVTPAWDAFYRDTRRGANLDVMVRLMDSNGVEVAQAEPTAETNAVLSATVPAGRYYLVVSGVGNATTPYSDYGSLGQYVIRGTVPVISSDTTAPTPNPMGWAVVPAAESSTVITMTAQTATDDSGVVQYQFRCVSGGAGCVDSPWQSGPSYQATGLSAHSRYGFVVVARDASGNQTVASVVGEANTLNTAPVAVDDNASALQDTSITVDVLQNDSDADGDVLVLASLGQPSHGTLTHLGDGRVLYAPAAGYAGADSFSYSVSDGFGGSANATVSIVVTEAPSLPTPPDGLVVVANADASVTVSWNDNSGNEIGFEIQRESLHARRGVWRGTTTFTAGANSVVYTDSPGAGTFRYRVRATNANGASEWTPWIEVTVTDTGSGGGGCKGKKKNC